VLSVLVFGGPKTMAQLADIEQVKRPTMTRIVTTLENWALVERRRGTDRRSMIVQATPSGRVVMIRARSDRMAVLEERMEKLAESEIAPLVRGRYTPRAHLKGEPLP
jgi:DNA-binding MarR family transcriptional regulator